MTLTRALSCRHVLAIQDTPHKGDLFAAEPTEAGYRVSTAGFSDEPELLLQRVTTEAPDLIVLEFSIGGEWRAWQVLERLKGDPHTRAIPVIACTGAVTRVAALQTQLAPMQVGVVLKPLDLDALLGEITRVWAGDAPHEETLRC